MSARQQQFWVVVPAAGRGLRFGAEIPKQFLPLHGRPVLVHTLERLLAHPRICGVQLVMDPDQAWRLPLDRFEPTQVRLCDGGLQRSDSVLAGLHALPDDCAGSDFVLVHDAARPLLAKSELDQLFAALDAGAEGALLALPVSDSLKRADAAGKVQASVDRALLWRALTPQAFRRGRLIAALQAVKADGRDVTDESEAMLLSGTAAQLVIGDPRNIKITTAADLELAAELLKSQDA